MCKALPSFTVPQVATVPTVRHAGFVPMPQAFPRYAHAVPFGGPFDFLGSITKPLVDAATDFGESLLSNDPTADFFCGIRDALPPPVRAALMTTSSPPFSVVERVANFTVVSLIPLQAGLMFPPALPLVGLFSVPFTLIAEGGRFFRRAFADCGIFNALRGEARDTLTLLNFWTPQNPVGGPLRTALDLAGGGSANSMVDRLRGPLKAVLQPIADGRLPAPSAVLAAVMAIFNVAVEFSDDPDLARGREIAADAQDLWCSHPALTGDYCGQTLASFSLTLPSVQKQITSALQQGVIKAPTGYTVPGTKAPPTPPPPPPQSAPALPLLALALAFL